MALPKEPRQKMINMMYLVLTALLALNVSSEILNAFKIVDKSLIKSNTNISSANDVLYSSLKEKMNDPQQGANARIWQPIAEQVGKISGDMSKMIQDYKGQLIVEAGGANASATDFKEDNLDAATRLFDSKGEGAKLFASLQKFKQDVLALNPELKANFEKTFPVELEGSAKDWTIKNFHMVPTVAGLTILSKLQNDVKNAENQLVTYCHSKLGQVKVQFDTYASLVGQSSEYVMPGEQIKIRAGVGAFSTSASPSITIAGRSASINSEGFAELPVDAGGSGEHSATVTISYTTQSGEKKTETKTVKWMVGTPGSAAVSADKMNVLYIGVDNPLTVSAGAGLDKLEGVSISNGNVSGSGAKWVARPSSEGNATVTVRADGKSSSFPFRVKTLPPASAFIGQVKEGEMPAASFRAMGGVRAQLENSEFDAPYKVVSYQITASGPGFPGGPAFGSNEGGFWAGNAATIANKAVPGTIISISKIVVQGPDGKPRKAANPSIVIRCQ
ncbi:MAG: gliding motility protein GldM [Dinghuibacter sp.]|nr:gliding motility protein GldM [Dinghuibacter sp.]